MGSLILLPNFPHPEKHTKFFPFMLADTLKSLEGILCESEKSARHFLREFLPRETWQKLRLERYNEHQIPNEKTLFSSIKQGQSWGVLSDAGLPCLADPGVSLVKKAQQKGICVQALPGPSAIVQTILLSGLGEKGFCFMQYLPKKPEELQQKLLSLQKMSKETSMTYVWIETPYRAAALFATCLSTLQNSTYLCVAQELFSSQEMVRTKNIDTWKKELPLEKGLTVFALCVCH